MSKVKIQDIKRRSNEKILTVSDLSGGLNKKASVYDLRDDEAIGLINFIFTETGILKVRPGYIKHNKIVLTNSIYGLYRFYKSDGSNKYFVATSGTSIYYDNNRTWDALTSDVTFTSNKRFTFRVFDDLLLMTNGANKPVKWLGGSSNNIKQIGLVAPASGAEAEDSGIAGNPNGTYLYKITYYNSTTGELTKSNACAAFGTAVGTAITVASKKINLKTIPQSSDPQVDYIRIYRTVDSGSTYYRVADIADGVTTYSDNSTDTAIQSNATYTTNSGDNDPPPTDAKYIEIAGRRTYLYNNSSYPSRLYWSETDECEYFGSGENYRDININDGDIGTGIIFWNNYLYCFKENSTWVLTDPADPANSNLEQVSPNIGCVSPFSLQTGTFQRPLDIPGSDYILVDGIIVNSRFGVMGFDGNQFWPLSERIEPIIDSLYETNIKEMAGFFNNNKYYLAYTSKKGNVIDGGFVTNNQYTTDTGDENKDAAYSTNHDANNFESGTDARIDLDNTSSENENVTVTIYIDWITQNIDDIEKVWVASLGYEIFFSYDSGTSWTSKGVFIKNTLGGSEVGGGLAVNKNLGVFTFSHDFFDSNVTSIRLDYFNDWASDLGITGTVSNYIRLESVKYWYEYTAAITGSDVVNNKVLYYDTLHNAWSELRGIKANCFTAWNGSGDEREEFFGGSKLGHVYRMNVGTSDDDKEIFALYQSKHFDCTDRSRKKRFHQFNLTTDIFNNIIHIDVFVDRTQRTSWKTSLLPTGENTTYWNEKYFGDFTWDRIINLINKVFRMPSASLGKFISVQIWTSSKESLAIQDYSIKYITRESMR